MPSKAKAKTKAQSLTPEQAVAAARENPAAFLALCLGKPVSDLQRGLLAHGLKHHSWYAELPRGHAKTSTLTYLAAWWLGRRPATRFKLIGQNDGRSWDEHGSSPGIYPVGRA